MTDRGIYGVVTDGSENLADCLLIGEDIPRVHHSDGVPVYLVVEHDQGLPVAVANGTKANRFKRLLAYPSHWPGPSTSQGEHEDMHKWVYAYHEPMPWNALIPLFDLEET